MPKLLNNKFANRLHSRTKKYTYSDVAVYYDTPDAETNLDSYGQVPDVTNGTIISCNFTDKVKPEMWQTDFDIAIAMAEIRFDEITPTKGGKFVLTHRFGVLLNSFDEYEIEAIRDRGDFGWICLLKKVTV